MMILRCKCGDKTCYTSMGSQDCEGCEKCNTTFAAHPDNHNELKPHEFITKYNSDTGKPYKWCKRCGQKDQESWEQSNIKSEAS